MLKRLEFSFSGQAVGLLVTIEVPRHDCRLPYELFRSHGAYLWGLELAAKQRARCYYDTNGGRVSFDTRRIAPTLLDRVTRKPKQDLQLSEFEYRPWAVVKAGQACTVADMLVALRSGGLPGGWIFVSDSQALSTSSECMVVSEADVGGDEAKAAAAANAGGLHRQGLSTQKMETVMTWANEENPRRPGPGPHAVDNLFGLLLRLSWMHPDAFPARPPPPPEPPPSAAEDRQFYDAIGPERADPRCAKEGCGRGAVELSVMCRVHHFEMVMERPCPFSR